MKTEDIFKLLKEKFGDAVTLVEAKQAPAPKPAAPPAAAGAAKPPPAAAGAAKPAAPAAAAKPAAPAAGGEAKPAPEKPVAAAPKPEGPAAPVHAKPAEAPAANPAAPAAAAAATPAAAPAAPAPATTPAAPTPKPAAPPAAGAPAATAAKPAAPAAPAAPKPAAGPTVPVGDASIKVMPPEKLDDVMAFLRDDPRLAFNTLQCISGLDQKDGVEIVYHLYSLPRKPGDPHGHRHWATIRTMVPRANGAVPTMAHLWKGAIWLERETYDMYGVKFTGNPDLRRILCPDDWEGWPLLKDYKVQEFYRGMPVPYHPEHWVGDGTYVTKMEDVSAETLEQWYQMGLKSSAAPAEAAAGAATATATAAPPAAAKPAEAPKPAAPAAKPAEAPKADAPRPEIKTESKPGEGPSPDPGAAPKPS